MYPWFVSAITWTSTSASSCSSTGPCLGHEQWDVLRGGSEVPGVVEHDAVGDDGAGVVLALLDLGRVRILPVQVGVSHFLVRHADCRALSVDPLGLVLLDPDMTALERTAGLQSEVSTFCKLHVAHHLGVIPEEEHDGYQERSLYLVKVAVVPSSLEKVEENSVGLSVKATSQSPGRVRMSSSRASKLICG